ncbi:UNVERIFIED_CONTAM: hypothetical protein K2H54_020549 [Gekko kuhli]
MTLRITLATGLFGSEETFVIAWGPSFTDRRSPGTPICSTATQKRLSGRRMEVLMFETAIGPDWEWIKYISECVGPLHCLSQVLKGFQECLDLIIWTKLDLGSPRAAAEGPSRAVARVFTSSSADECLLQVTEKQCLGSLLLLSKIPDQLSLMFWPAIG